MNLRFAGTNNCHYRRRANGTNFANGILRRSFVALLFLLLAIVFGACVGHNYKSSMPAGCTAQVLLFNGDGVSANDVVALETVLDNNHLCYSTVSSSELNGMSELEMRKYSLLIVPGGNFIDMGNSLSRTTTANARNAVKNGLNYLGICAGGFLAGSSSYYNGFELAAGISFDFYAAEAKGIRKAAVAVTTPGGPTLDQYWEDGPQFTGWGAVAARYPDGTPAVVQGAYGKGSVTLVGIHPEAPENWRGTMRFNTPASTDNAYAGQLIRAALGRQPLPHY